MSNQSMTIAYPSNTHPALPDALTARIEEAVAHSKAANTLRAYRSDLRQFTTWCEGHHLTTLPAAPETVAAYAVDQRATHRLSTIRRQLSSIAKAHLVAGLPNPCASELLRATVSGLARQQPQTPKRATAMTPDYLRQTLTAIRGAELPDLRDRALLLVGWCAALRRSEIAGLRWCDIEIRPAGVVLTLHGTKTDKTGEGQRSPLAAEQAAAVCPVRALRAWQAVLVAIDPALIEGGAPVFRQVNRHGGLGGGLSGHAVGAIVAGRSRSAGLEGVTGHSLRRGLTQAAYLAGVGDSAIIQTTRHRSIAMLRTYQGDAGLIERAASRGLLV
jgi:integrase